MVVKGKPGFRWDGVNVHPYKEDGTHFRDITRQTLFKGDSAMPFEFRYFEVNIGGYSTLERHVHQHLVMVIRGRGTVLVGEEVIDIDVNDVIHIPPMTFHQFHANCGEHLGFICVVCTDRDKPQRPDLIAIDSFGLRARELVKI